MLLALLASLAWPLAQAAATPDDTTQPAPKPTDVEDDSQNQTAPPGLGLARWINPSTAPFIPVPVIGADPNSGTTLGILPTWVHTNDKDEISRIIAPDLIHNPDFGWGADARIFDYPSNDEQWSLVAELSQRTQRGFDGEYQTELTRQRLWSFDYSVIYDQNGAERFYGIGNDSRKSSETNYTKSQELVQVQTGLNLSHEWQILYTLRTQRYEVRPGTLNDLPSIETRYPDLEGLGATTAIQNRLALVYDTRDDRVIPTSGAQTVLYGGLASRNGIFNDSMYSEAGLDARAFWSFDPKAILAVHTALRYLPTEHDLPFWAYSSLGGDRDFVGGDQELRGYGAGRFYGRNSFATTIEMRKTLFGFDAASSHIDIEGTPFIDVGDVFESGDPFRRLHTVAGFGFRGVARPFIVGYVDLGYGHEGLAAFTGIDYPF